MKEAPVTHRWLTTTEAADALRVDVQTARRWAREGYLPAVRVGAKWLIDAKRL